MLAFLRGPSVRHHDSKNSFTQESPSLLQGGHIFFESRVIRRYLFHDECGPSIYIEDNRGSQRGMLPPRFILPSIRRLRYRRCALADVFTTDDPGSKGANSTNIKMLLRGAIADLQALISFLPAYWTSHRYRLRFDVHLSLFYPDAVC
jgi:hypothetical protein